MHGFNAPSKVEVDGDISHTQKLTDDQEKSLAKRLAPMVSALEKEY